MRTPTLDPNAAVSAATQIASHFEHEIHRGALRSGDRLPTIRAIAGDLGVSRAVVESAYRSLSREGLVIAAVGRGTTVAPGVAAGAGAGGRNGARGKGGSSESGAAGGVLSPFAAAALQQLREAPRVPELPSGVPLVANFRDLPRDPSQLPAAALRTSLDHVLAERGGALLGYGAPAGLASLRERLAARSPEADRITSDHVLVTSGAQQGIDLVLRTFTAAGDAVAVLAPTYQQLFGLLEAHGLDAIAVPSPHGGLPDPEALRRVLARTQTRLLYLVPTFQNPTGRTFDETQRRELMQVVTETNVPVIEDEVERGLRFRGVEPPSLFALDERGLTVTIRSFSKGLFPGLRIGWVQAREPVLQPMTAVKRFMDLDTSPLLQAALVHMLDSGVVDAHLEELCTELAARHACAHATLAAHAPAGMQWTQPDGGFALWLELGAAAAAGAAERLAPELASRGVLVTPGAVFDPTGRPSTGCRISLSRTGVDSIESGLRIVCTVAADLARGEAARPLLL